MSVELFHGDCREVLDLLPSDSVDSCVTDPPYHFQSIQKRFAKVGRDDKTWSRSGPHQRTARGFMNQTWDGGDIAFDPALWLEVLRVLKPGAHLLAFGGTRTYHRMACAIEDAGFEIRDQIGWVYGQGFPKSHNLDGDWQGWGTALKPAWEPICVARKPLIGTVEKNVQTHGVGALNIDGCRIDTRGETIVPHVRDTSSAHEGWTRPWMSDKSKDAARQAKAYDAMQQLGRWPANLIHDGSDEVVSAFPDAPGQLAPISATAPSEKTSNVYGRMNREGEASADSDNEGAVGFKMKPGARRLDAGSAARFFYCAKASRADRNDGLEGFDEKPLLWSAGTQNPGSFQSEGTKKAAKNNHPTVKPTALMQYLCRLVTPPGGVVLDPFAGSGSTGRGAALEGFRFIGIEQSAEYLAIARARIAAVQKEDIFA